MSTKVLVVRRRLPAPPERVYEAWVDPRVMSRWFFAGTDWTARVSADSVVGGHYHIDMIMPDGTVAQQWGEYRELDPPRRIVFTWNNDLVEDTLVTIELEAVGSETDLTLQHVLPDDPEIRQMHNTGWEACLENLELLMGA